MPSCTWDRGPLNKTLSATGAGSNRSLTSRASASCTLTTPPSLPTAVSLCDDDDDDPVVDIHASRARTTLNNPSIHVETSERKINLEALLTEELIHEAFSDKEGVWSLKQFTGLCLPEASGSTRTSSFGAHAEPCPVPFPGSAIPGVLPSTVRVLLPRCIAGDLTQSSDETRQAHTARKGNSGGPASQYRQEMSDPAGRAHGSQGWSKLTQG